MGGRALEGWSAVALAAVVLVGTGGTAYADTGVLAGEGFVRPIDGTYDLVGHGFGHGRGMSQWGANAAASNGHGYQEILRFYYPGTRLVDDHAPKTLRVRLSHNGTEVRVRSEPGLEVWWTKDNGDLDDRVLPAKLGGCTVSTWRVVGVAGKDMSLQGYSCAKWRTLLGTRDVGGGGRVSFVTKDDTFMMERRPSGKVTRRLYRGDLRVVLRDKVLRPINIVRYDDYLRSVIPSESPASWPVAALRAQAVAARTYALRSALNRKDKYFDVYDTTASQVYPGIASLKSTWAISRTYEKERTNDAVKHTKNQTLKYGKKAALTEFGSSNGGWTANGGVPYLLALKDSWDYEAERNPRRDWNDTVTVSRLEQRYPKIGKLVELRVLDRSGGGDWGGRVCAIRIVGTRGSRDVKGEDAVRNALGLSSAWFTVRV